MSEPPIYHVRVAHMAKIMPGNVEVVLPGQKTTHTSLPGTYRFEVVFPDMAPYDECLGRFLRNWGKLETIMEHLFVRLLGAEHARARAIFSANSGKAARDLIERLSGVVNDDTQHARIVDLLERFSKANTCRNFIVHGLWVGEIRTWNSRNGDFNIRLEVQREYRPTQPGGLRLLADPKNQKLRAKHIFRTKKIDEVGNVALALARDIATWLKEADHLPQVLPEVSP